MCKLCIPSWNIFFSHYHQIRESLKSSVFEINWLNEKSRIKRSLFFSNDQIYEKGMIRIMKSLNANIKYSSSYTTIKYITFIKFIKVFQEKSRTSAFLGMIRFMKTWNELCRLCMPSSNILLLTLSLFQIMSKSLSENNLNRIFFKLILIGNAMWFKVIYPKKKF